MLKGLVVTILSVAGAIAVGQSASALGNIGYFSNNWTCNSSDTETRACADPDAYYQNDVVLGRPGVASAVPYFGNDKFAYRKWVIDQYNAGGDRRVSARFIIATMLGSPSQADNIAEFSQRFDNPSLHMRVENIADPLALGSISYRGINEFGNLDFFWEANRHGSPGNVYIFSLSPGGAPIYALQQNCGNPVGLPNVGILPYNPEDWEVSAGAKVRINTGDPATTPAFGGLPNGGTITASVGQTVEWELWLRNDGPTGMTTGVRYVGVRGATPTSRPGWDNNHLIGNFPNHPFQTATVGAAGDYIYGSWFDGHLPKPPTAELRFERYVIDANDVGRTICQHMAAYPRAHDNHTWFDSEPACVHVPYTYGLTPIIDISQASVESADETFSINTHVSHDHGTPSRDTEWRIIKLVLPATDPDPTASVPFNATGDSNLAPCDYFGIVNCDEFFWSDNRVFISGITPHTENTSIGPVDFDIGNRICYAAAISTPTHDPTPVWRYSALDCVLIAKRPKVQFWGADVRSGGRVSTNKTEISTAPPKVYGSWGEYGVFASGVVNSSSGGALASGPGGRTPYGNARDYNKITFANTGANLGHFGSIPPTQISPLFSNSPSTPLGSSSVNIGALALPDAINHLSYSGDLELTGGVVPAGKSIILRVDGAVTITGNIDYSGGGSISDLSQLVILSNSIIIDPDVDEVNAWLIARPAPGTGYVSTCGPVTMLNWLDSINNCSKSLRINGPIITDSLYLRRTFGSETANFGEPAEVINLRPDTYLWAYHMARSTGSIKTGHTRELPPRF